MININTEMTSVIVKKLGNYYHVSPNSCNRKKSMVVYLEKDPKVPQNRPGEVTIKISHKYLPLLGYATLDK
jgi:hypothetical protein